MFPLAVMLLKVGFPSIFKSVKTTEASEPAAVLVITPCVALPAMDSTTEVPFTWTSLAFTVPLALMFPLEVIFPNVCKELEYVPSGIDVKNEPVCEFCI